MSIHSRVLAFIRRHSLISEGDRVLVAVSGGPDSVALLHWLQGLRDEFRLHLEVAHLQHGIRGEQSKEDAGFVADLADQLAVPFHLKEINLPEMKHSAGKGNLEALARAERYRFFAQVVDQRRLDKVATAHTEDDQAETVLMWFLRGAGTKGLGGMAPRQEFELPGGESMQKLVVVRPLLETPKAEVLQFLQERKLACRLDDTNLDPAYLRNWIRLELLPFMSRRVDVQLAARLVRQAELCRDEEAVLDELARRSYEAMLEGEGVAARQVFLEQPRALQRRVLRLWIERTRGHLRGIELVHIEQILRLILEGPPQGRTAIPGGWEFLREYDTLKLVRRFRSGRRVCYSYRLEIGKRLAITEAALELHSRCVPARAQSLPESLMEALFDAASLTEPLTVRNFRSGDRFHPLGMSGHKKIKDLFIEKRVPLPVRARWPLLTSGDEVLWIPRYGRSSAASVSEKTRTILHLKARSIPDSPEAR